VDMELLNKLDLATTLKYCSKITLVIIIYVGRIWMFLI